MKRNRQGFLGIPAVSKQRAAEAALPRLGEESVLTLERRLLARLAEGFGNPDIRIRLWDGSDFYPGSPTATVGITIHDRRALWRLVFHPELYFGDDYALGRIEVDGGLVNFLEAIFSADLPEKSDFKEQLRQRLNRVSENSLTGARRNIHHHYDLSNDFYRRWLDHEMQYTCAYFPSPDVGLEEAQAAKMDHVCRKLRLQPGETVFEAGCGWGGLARHMARHYGVTVRAFNISSEQVQYARERARAEGLEGRIEYVQDDYRNMSGCCDAFVSVGMLEHVGVEHYHELGGVIDRSLGANGRGLIHSIGKIRPEPMTAWIERRIFPGACPPSLSQMMAIFEPHWLSVLDVENLRLHYALTLEHWLERFESHSERIEQMFDESFVRAWRFYLASSIASFRTGGLQLYQVLFSRQRNNLMPWTRAYMYREGE